MVTTQRAVTVHNTLNGVVSTYGGLIADLMGELEVSNADRERLSRELAEAKTENARLSAALGDDLAKQAAAEGAK